MNNFIHTHTHSSFSYLDGYGNIKDYAARAKELKMDALAITDHGNLDGAINFQKECLKQGIEPIIGAELYITPDANIKDKTSKYAHILFLIKSQQGFETLCKLLTKANLHGFYRKPRIDFSDLLNSDLSGLIITTACLNSWVNFEQGEEVLKALYDKYPENIYLEIMPHDLDLQYTHNKKILKLHEKYGIPMVATNDCHYVNKDDAESQDILLAIQSKKKWDDPKRFRFSIQGLHLATRREMIFAFKKHSHIFSKEQVQDALNITQEIAEKCCNFRIKQKEISLPTPHDKNSDDNQILGFRCASWLNTHKMKDGIKAKDFDIYYDRYKREIALIKKKKFSRYFLVVGDVVEWAKKERIEVGPGRGSAGGSLVCFMCGITNIDPIKYGLSFSRFISEDRGDWPDIDIDFEKRYKSKVYEYLKNKYGEHNICGISTVMKMQSNAALRDVCRVFDKKYGITQKEISEFAGLIKTGNIQDAIDDNKVCANFEKKYPKVIHFAKKMEGVIRGVGRHAAAVVVSDEDLTLGTKCNLVKRKGDIVCNWDMDNSEYSGLMKLDVLGLSTLTVLSECRELINSADAHKRCFWYHAESDSYFVDPFNPEEIYDSGCIDVDFDYDKIPFDCPKAFELLKTGKTAGFFQMSTSALSKLCQKIKIDNFNDIVAAIALVRPGPWKAGMTDKYINRKHGEDWKKLHPIYEDITKKTFGVLCYQEQITEVIHRIAGLSKVVADKIRKIIAKKRDPKLLEEYHNVFIDGCIKEKTLTKKQAVSFWDDLMEDASYSFNLSHSTAYAIIGYWTAWLKANYPVEFICSSLSFAEWDEKSNDIFKRKSTLIEELKETGIKVLPPKIGHSDPIKWVVKGGICYIPFVEIKGIGENQAQKCNNLKQKKGRLKGFFNDDRLMNQNKTKVEIIMDELCCFDHDKKSKNKIIKKYLGYEI